MTSTTQNSYAVRALRSRSAIKRSAATALVSCTLSSGVAASDAGRSGTSELETVVVTAQRREERLIDAPISIGVLSGDELDKSTSRSVTDILNEVAGVSISQITPGNSQIGIRGVISSIDSGTSPVGYYIDETPFAFINSARLPDTNGFDLQRIEVLRGPQGTLYGANALSGVVRVLTNDADPNQFELKGRLRGSHTDESGGNYGGDVAVNAPLVDGKLAIRGVASYSEQGGYITSQRDGATEINDVTAQSYRLKLGYRPIDSLAVDLSHMRTKTDVGASNWAVDDYTTPLLSDLPQETLLDASNLLVRYDLPSFSILSSTSYLDYKWAITDDLISFTFFSQSDLKSWNQEVRLVSHLEGPWQWSVGVFYRDAEERLFQDAHIDIPTLSGLLDVLTKSESYAVFSELTRSFADDKLELTGGVRYFHDRIGQWQLSGFNPSAALADPVSDEFSKVTWRAVLSYKPADDLSLYASAATGFRSGRQQSSSALTIDPTLPPVDPDSITTYEVGAKGYLLGNVLNYELGTYYTKWEDIQQQIQLGAFQAYLNAGRASGFGAEASLTVRPNDRFELHGNVGWNDLKMDENVTSGGLLLFTEGSRVNDSPKWTGSVGGSYTTPVWRDDISFVLSTDIRFASERLRKFLSGGAVTTRESDKFEDVALRFGFQGPHWLVEFFADNLLNYDDAITPREVTRGEVAVRARPRTIGLQASWSY